MQHIKTHENTKVKASKEENKDPIQPPPLKRPKILHVYECKVCRMEFGQVKDLQDHATTHQKEEKKEIPDDVHMEGALNNALKVVTFEVEGTQKVDLLQLFSDRRDDIVTFVMKEAEKKKRTKWHMSCAIKFVRYDKEGNEIDTVGFFNSICSTTLIYEEKDSVENKVDEGYMKMFNSCQEFQREGSGWVIEEILHLKLMMGIYKPLKGSRNFEVPKKICNNKGILNFDNKDYKCFLWCVLAALHPVTQNAHQSTNYKEYEHELNMKGITYPVAVKKVPTFEKQNNISVNVFGFEDEYYPLYISPEQKETHVNLLLIHDEKKSHYCLIKNLGMMLSSQTKHNGKTYYCTYCLHGFVKEDNLLKHKPICKNHGLQHTALPDEENKWMKFTNIKKMLKVPYVIYADFECILQPSTKKNTVSQHKACGYSYLVVSSVMKKNVKQLFIEVMMLHSIS